MSIRNTIVIISKKLAGFCFFGMFVYVLIAKGMGGLYGLRPEYGFFLFFASLFFFGLMTLPNKFEFSKDFFKSLLLPVSFLLAAIGMTLLFGRLIVFNVTLEDPFVIYGAIAFIWGIVFMIASAAVGDSKTSRTPDDTAEIKKALEDVAKDLDLQIHDKSIASRLEFDAKGDTSKGQVHLNVKNDLMVKRSLFKMEQRKPWSLVSTSILTLNPKGKIANSAVEIETVNDAINIKNVTKQKEEVLRKFILEKNLEYFNFRLLSSQNEVFVTIDLAIEEKEAWLDFLDLMELAAI